MLGASICHARGRYPGVGMGVGIPRAVGIPMGVAILRG